MDLKTINVIACMSLFQLNVDDSLMRSPGMRVDNNSAVNNNSVSITVAGLIISKLPLKPDGSKTLTNIWKFSNWNRLTLH